jgi:hypothetical protein
LAFEDDLGIDPSQARAEPYIISATGVVSRTFSLWLRKLVQYIIIIGITGAVLALVSFVVLFTMFATVGTIGPNPISYILNLFSLTTAPVTMLVAFSVVFASIGFVIDAILSGAATKFALDDYTGKHVAKVGASFSFATKKTLNIMVYRIITTVLVTGALTPAFVLLTQAMSLIDINNPVFTPDLLEAMGLGLVYFLIGGIFALYIFIRFAPTVAIIVDTDLSAIDSMKKSWEITSGNVLHAFGSIILMGLIVVVMQILVSMALFFIPYDLVIQAIIIALLFNVLRLIFNVVLYEDLISRKGESSLDSLMVGEY